MSVLNQIFLGNSLERWLSTFLTALLITVILRGALALIRNRATRLAESTSTIWDDVLVKALSSIRFSLIAPAVFCFAFSTLALPENIKAILSGLGVVLLNVQSGISLDTGFSYWLDIKRKKRLATDPSAISSYGALRFIGRLVIWVVIFLLTLDNLGVDVSALVTGLGVSGIAVALAVQNILGDLFASLTIILDKPFVVGNFLQVGNYAGSVEHIGLKTTRLRSLSGEQLIFSNNDLLQSRIQNYGRLEQRRVVFSVGVTYQTSPEHLEAIPGLIKDAVEQQSDVRFDRSHFSSFGDFAMLFETVYYVTKPDYAAHMDIKHNINLIITRAFAERGIDFAYPTQTIHLQNPPAAST